MEQESKIMKCRKCRHVLLNDLNITHNLQSCGTKDCASYDLKRFVFVYEDKMPTWIRTKVEDEQWTKGKLHCENCGYKVGSYDFISGRKCDCGKSVLPPIHFISSQVDIPIPIKSSIKT